MDTSPRSIDYVCHKKQFQLHDLLTEQRHSRTWDLSYVIKKEVTAGLEQIFSVDKDIEEKFDRLSENPLQLEQAAQAVCRAVLEGKKIFVYGCGSTGRLAKQMESALWRPFWKRIRTSSIWEKLKSFVPENISELLIGEMTGGDRALISALEGLEDLLLVGELQLKDRGVEKGDVVFCITEGGETSSVIGVILAAAELYGDYSGDSRSTAASFLYFIYNNPDQVIRSFERSRAVLEHSAITRIELTTGPQAVAGSTRMQAATSETYVLGLILEFGIYSALKKILSEEDLTEIGFSPDISLKNRLMDFKRIRAALLGSIKDIAAFTELETRTYKTNRFATYFADNALITVFIDCAERSPTFHLHPLDTVEEKKRKCWLQVWTKGSNQRDAWRNFLGRDFRGLDEKFYKPFFLQGIGDDYLREAALNSLAQAGSEQEELYDFSFSQNNLSGGGPQRNDLGVLVCVDDEIEALADPDSLFARFVFLCKNNEAKIALILVGDQDPVQVKHFVRLLSLNKDRDVVIFIYLERAGDPMGLNRQILLKILLNGHSTGVMAGIGKIVGNTMTNVFPSNLKLIGRATYLIQSHVNDAVPAFDQITYAEANAVLFNTIEYTAKQSDPVSEVELAVVRILKVLLENKIVSLDEAWHTIRAIGLENFLLRFNPGLHRKKV